MDSTTRAGGVHLAADRAQRPRRLSRVESRLLTAATATVCRSLVWVFDRASKEGIE